MSRRPHLPSGLSCGLDFLSDADWSPEQALVVFELLNDLRAHLDALRRAVARPDHAATVTSRRGRHRRYHRILMNPRTS